MKIGRTLSAVANLGILAASNLGGPKQAAASYFRSSYREGSRLILLPIIANISAKNQYFLI